MTTLELRGERVDIRETVGAGISLTITCVDSAGDPVDISGYTFAADIKRGNAVVDSFNQAVSGASNNILTLSLTGAETTAIGTGRGLSWSLKVTIAGVVDYWYGGLFQLYNPDEPRSTGYTSSLTAVVGASLTATLTAHVPANASAVPITDAGTYFASSTVEGALQEVGADLAALPGTYGLLVKPTSRQAARRLIQALDANQNCGWLHLGDSTADATTDFQQLLATHIGQMYPSHTVTRQEADSTGLLSSPTTLRTGTGSATLTTVCAARSGYLSTTWTTAIEAGNLDTVTPDLITVYLGANESDTEATFKTNFGDLLDAVAVKWPDVPVIVGVQHYDTTDTTGSTNRRTWLGELMQTRGEAIADDAWQAMGGTDAVAAYYTDNIHPTSAGITVLTSAWAEIIGLPRRVAADGLFVPAGAFHGVVGSPSLAADPANRKASWAFDGTSSERIDSTIFIPPGWNRVVATVVWSNGGAGSGGVYWSINLGMLSDGTDLTAFPSAYAGGGNAASAAIDTAAADNVCVLTDTGVMTVKGGNPYTFWIDRQVAATEDTLANDALFFGLILRPVIVAGVT